MASTSTFVENTFLGARANKRDRKNTKYLEYQIMMSAVEKTEVEQMGRKVRDVQLLGESGSGEGGECCSKEDDHRRPH